MNNVSFIHLIYVNDEQRVVYDGSLQGFKKAVAKLGISISDLYHGSMHGEDTTEEVSEYLFQMHEDACWVLDSDIEGIDSLGVYLCTDGAPEIEAISTEESQAEYKAWRASITSYEGDPRYAGMNAE